MASVTIKQAGEDLDIKSHSFTDKRGRVITLTEPSFLSEFRLMEAVGPELASNSTWMAVFGPLTYISKIDNDDILPVQNKIQTEALIQRVGRETYAMLFEALKEHFAASDEDLDFAKNSAGTQASDSA